MENTYERVYARVDLSRIKTNVLTLRNHVNKHKKDVKLMAVIKADGYGHGAIPIGRELEKIGIDYIAVAIYQEGIQLRKEGIKIPILVLGNTPESAYSQLLEYQLAQTVYSWSMAQKINAYCSKVNKQLNIHLKLDSGMGRIGIPLRNKPIYDSVSKILDIYNLKNIMLEGLFTHFSKADEIDKDYTNKQVDLFNSVVLALDKEGVKPEYIHAANSAGLMDVPKGYFNMVRAGIAMYGLYPSQDVDHSIKLKPALSIISRVVYIKELEKGEAISYGGTYITDKKTKVATVPIGYADGYSRALSNKGRVVINGQYANVIGRVCMDMILVDVTHIDQVSEDDEVYLIGGTDEASIHVEEIAEHMKTINYEVVCLIGKRVPRVYIKENEVIETIDYF